MPWEADMANAKTSVKVNIDADVRELASVLLGRMGLDETIAIDLFFRQIIAERRLPFQPAVIATLDERISEAAARKAGRAIELATNENGDVFVDKDIHPELYEWAANG